MQLEFFKGAINRDWKPQFLNQLWKSWPDCQRKMQSAIIQSCAVVLWSITGNLIQGFASSGQLFSISVSVQNGSFLLSISYILVQLFPNHSAVESKFNESRELLCQHNICSFSYMKAVITTLSVCPQCSSDTLSSFQRQERRKKNQQKKRLFLSWMLVIFDGGEVRYQKIEETLKHSSTTFLGRNGWCYCTRVKQAAS